MKLNDRYTLDNGTVYLTGIQALVRLPMDQMRRDRRAGLKTGTFISGYEGSPLGGYDMALGRERALLDQLDIHVWPGVNEDMAATAIFGSQIYQVMQSSYDGVVGIWYGKGPGVDRSGDILRHANLAGSPGQSAALVLAGDDHACKSSSIPHQSDFSLMNVGIPVLFPGNTQEILDFGLLGIAMSRFTGAWCGLKLLTQICDGGGTVDVGERRPVVIPVGYQKKTDPRLVIPHTNVMEHEVNRNRLEAAKEFARANHLNRWFGAKDNAWLGIATAGKSYFDLMQAFRDMGISSAEMESMGIRVAKFGMTFPIEPHFALDFATGLRKILVIEEKRSFLEMQLRDVLFNTSARPMIIGKEDEAGIPLLPAANEMDPDMIARAVVGSMEEHPLGDSIRRRLERLDTVLARPRELVPARPPNFCSGCPHNRSTLLPDGRVAGGGIGCHGMSAMLADSNRGYLFCTHMGGEGVPWIGMSPFVERKHLFQNIGDGTFFHSGSIAIESAVAAGVNITYKILYNGHVAMTGGQQAVGVLPVPALTRKLEAEGVKKIVVLAEDTSKYIDGVVLAKNAEVRDRSELEKTMAELEKVSGVTVIIYDQQCAAEKRRMRSRGKLTEPVKRLVVHQEVCEGCGDCVKQSNCMSLHPVPTELGQKIQIHQSSCNKDYSCALGDCPSFLTVNIAEGSGLKKRTIPQLPDTDVPAPHDVVRAGDGYRILMPGIGGTGVVTINALLATAALMDGLQVNSLDQTGLAQKGGAVMSHLLLSETPIEASARTNIGNTDLILGFDMLGAANAENLKLASADRTVAVLNTSHVPTGDEIRKRTVLAGPERLIDVVRAHTRHGRNLYLDASRIAEGLFGTHLAVNMFLLGAALQAGLLPVTEASLKEAIRLNGVEVERNLQILLWGRKYYHDAAAVEAMLRPKDEKPAPKFDRVAELRRFQNDSWAREYEGFVAGVPEALKEPVSRYLYKLMAYKDEYEVARLLTKPEVEEQVLGMWAKPESLSYNLHPPLLRAFGLKNKLTFGPWFKNVLKILAALKVVRGTPLDVFGYLQHRREERALIEWYRGLITEVSRILTPENQALAIEIASLPDQIRGYEQIKEQNIRKVKQLAQEKLAALKAANLQPV